MTTIWKAIPGYEGWYEASNEGQIRVLQAQGKGRRHSKYPYILTPLWYRKGYYKMQFGTCGGTRQRVREFVHRVIYRTFHGEIPEGMTVNHKDGIHSNNKPSNLELATYLEQCHHARRLGLTVHRTLRGLKRTHLTEADIPIIRQLAADSRLRREDIAAQFNISKSLVRFIQTRRIWKHVP